MQTSTQLLFGASLLFFSIPIITPFVVRIQKFKNIELAQKITKWHISVSIFVIFSLTTYFFGFRFQSGETNIVFIVLVAAAYLYLIGLIFQIKPRLLGATLGVVVAFLFLLVILMNILVSAIDGKTNRIELASNLYCEVYQFGFAGNPGGLGVSVYRYLGLGISRRLIRGSYLDEIKYPFNTQEGACKYTMARMSS